MKNVSLSIALMLALSACGGQFPNPFEGLKKKPDASTEASGGATGSPKETVEVGAGGQTADALDATTDAEKTAATTAPAGSAKLGTTVASLGDPTQQGFWLRTPLVTSEADGAVETEGGAVVQVKLIPIDGPATAGSRISLAAMRALGLGLTDLTTLKVTRS